MIMINTQVQQKSMKDRIIDLLGSDITDWGMIIPCAVSFAGLILWLLR